uniref:cytochrome P450 n=1 Tax=Paractinoplanes polyasparticus TaxID=2856853 RepID=UPI001C84E054|nr:cytochrome P450 [Actinoplanes polyasparticus]
MNRSSALPVNGDMSTERTPTLISDLPGPKPLPFLGNLREFSRGGRAHRVMEAWTDQYGLTYRIQLGGSDLIVTADPAHIDTILRNRPDDFQREQRTSATIDEIIGPGVFTAEDDRWRRLRKVATQSLNVAYLRQYFTTINRVTDRLVRQWDALASSGERIDVLNWMMRYTLDVTSGLAMGHDLNSLEDTGDGLHRRIPMIFPAFQRRTRTPVPYWRYVKLPIDRRLDATVREMESLVLARYGEAKMRVAAGEPPSNFLEALVKPIADEPAITDQEVVGNVFTMLVAGEDTTSSTAAWALHFLAEHPEIHAKVRAEADEVVGTQRIPGDPATVGRLKYAEAVVHEVLRVQPVAPIVGAQPKRDQRLTGRDGAELHLDQGQPMILLTSYGARRDTARFPDPDAFRPERWLEGKLPPEALPFTPFGNGPRFCPGRNLAIIEATMVTSVLGRAFELNPDRSGPPVTERLEFASYPTNLYLHATPRG